MRLGRPRGWSVHLVSFYTTAFLVIASTSIVIWNFRDPCINFNFLSKGSKSERKCWEGQGDFTTFKFTQYPPAHSQKLDKVTSKKKNKIGDGDMRSSLWGPEPQKRVAESLANIENVTLGEEEVHLVFQDDVEHFKNVQGNVTEYFKDRRKSTEDSCLKMFEEEEGVNVEEDPQLALKQLKKLEDFEKGQNRFFKQTNPAKRTRWIFYKHPDPSNLVEIEWCPLYKSASTPWMAIFTKLAKALTKITESKIRAGEITFVNLAKNFRLYTPPGLPDTSKGAKGHRYSMVVVRHPFKRILSAYQDKLERVKGREYYHRKYSASILHKFRQSPPRAKSSGGQPMWYLMALDLQKRYEVPPNQVQTVSNDTMRNRTRRSTPLKSVKAPGGPTFDEFCRYLLETEPTSMDEHWRPQYLDCSPCHHNFDLILKVETLEEDKEAVFKLLGYEQDVQGQSEDLDDLHQVWKRWKNPSRQSHNESFYFSQLSLGVMKGLYNLYQPDFVLFGYSHQNYFDMLKNKDKVS